MHNLAYWSGEPGSHMDNIYIGFLDNFLNIPKLKKSVLVLEYIV